MEAERYRIGEAAAERLERTRKGQGNLVAVGTTCVRTLETAVRGDGAFHSGEGSSDLFIYPPYRFQAVDILLTNFHLPRSSLIMLVSAFAAHGIGENANEAGLDLILKAYKEAVKKKYRFYSYGDCMLVV